MGAKLAQTGRTPFGNKLRRELDTRNWGVRTLARAMADKANQPERTESIRRQLKTYLTTMNPSRPEAASRHAIEDALGLKRDALKDDDEESQPPLRATVTIDLPQELVDRAVERALADRDAVQEFETA